jgi:hypothetical protein
MSSTTVLIIIGVLVVYLFRMLQLRPIDIKLALLPAVAIGYGLYKASALAPSPNAGAITILAICLASGLAAGLLLGRHFHIKRLPDGRWGVQGSWTTVLVFLLSYPLALAVRYAAIAIIPDNINFSFGGQDFMIPLLFSIGGLRGGQVLMLYLHYPTALQEGLRQPPDRHGRGRHRR